jgi:hypothetical protein
MNVEQREWELAEETEIHGKIRPSVNLLQIPHYLTWDRP